MEHIESDIDTKQRIRQAEGAAIAKTQIAVPFAGEPDRRQPREAEADHGGGPDHETGGQFEGDPRRSDRVTELTFLGQQGAAQAAAQMQSLAQIDAEK